MTRRQKPVSLDPMTPDADWALIQAGLAAAKQEQLSDAEACLSKCGAWRRIDDPVAPNAREAYGKLRKNYERAWRMRRRHLWDALRHLAEHKRLSDAHLPKLMRWVVEGARPELEIRPDAGGARISILLRFEAAHSAVAYAVLRVAARPEQFAVCEVCGSPVLNDPHVVGRKSERFCKGPRCRNLFHKRAERARAKHKSGEGP